MTDAPIDLLQRSYGMAPVAYLSDLPSSGMSLARWRREDAGADLIRHPQDAYTLSLMLRPMRAQAWVGTRQVWSGPIASQMFRITPPGLDPSWRSESGFDFLMVMIPVDVIDRAAGDRFDDLHATLAGLDRVYARDELTRNLVVGMFEAGTSTSPMAVDLADALGHALVVRVLDYFLAAPPSRARERLSPGRLRRVTDHIDANLASDVPVRELAGVAALSEAHFARAFREATGMSPHRYINARRIERAQAELSANDRSVLDIALEHGFKDASHFARVFRKVTGVSPTHYRQHG